MVRRVRHPALARYEISSRQSVTAGMVHECCNAPTLNMLVSQQLTPEQTLGGGWGWMAGCYDMLR